VNGQPARSATVGQASWPQRAMSSDGAAWWNLSSSIVMRLGIVVIMSAIAFGAPAAAADVRAYWSVAKVMRAIDNARIHIGGRVVRVDSDTTLCGGRGAVRTVRGIRRWRLFACTYTTFTKQIVGRDLDFRVRTRDARRFVITDARWVGETR
jgi:hypothetical protein